MSKKKASFFGSVSIDDIHDDILEYIKDDNLEKIKEEVEGLNKKNKNILLYSKYPNILNVSIKLNKNLISKYLISKMEKIDDIQPNPIWTSIATQNLSIFKLLNDKFYKVKENEVFIYTSIKIPNNKIKPLELILLDNLVVEEDINIKRKYAEMLSYRFFNTKSYRKNVDEIINHCCLVKSPEQIIEYFNELNVSPDRLIQLYNKRSTQTKKNIDILKGVNTSMTKYCTSTFNFDLENDSTVLNLLNSINTDIFNIDKLFEVQCIVRTILEKTNQSSLKNKELVPIPTKELTKYFNPFVDLTKGGFGNIYKSGYKGDDGDTHFIIKAPSANITRDDLYNNIKVIEGGYNSFDIFHEVAIGSIINNFKYAVKMPLYCHVYGAFYCEGNYNYLGNKVSSFCGEKGFRSTSCGENSCFTMFSVLQYIPPATGDPASSSLADLFKKDNLSPKQILLYVTIVAFSLYILQKGINFMHFDLHVPNVMMRTWDTTDIITIRGKKESLNVDSKMTSYSLPCMIDFGQSVIKHPSTGEVLTNLDDFSWASPYQDSPSNYFCSLLDIMMYIGTLLWTIIHKTDVFVLKDGFFDNDKYLEYSEILFVNFFHSNLNGTYNGVDAKLLFEKYYEHIISSDRYHNPFTSKGDSVYSFARLNPDLWNNHMNGLTIADFIDYCITTYNNLP